MTCTRRAFLLGTATTLAGAYLAACGKEASAEIAATDIPVGSGTIIDGVIFSQPTAGTFVAYSATCPHQGATINKIDGATAVCPSHHSVFDLATGSVVSGPAASGLSPLSVANDGTTVTASS